MENFTHKNLNKYVNAYERSTDTELSDVYSNCSDAKHKAMQYCKQLMDEVNGYNGRIVCHNTNTFTYAFQNDYNFYVITKSYNYYMPLLEVR